MKEKQYDIYDDAPGLDSEIEYEGIDSLLGSDCKEKITCPIENYYHCKKKFVFDSLKFISAQMNTYETALKEIKSGKKRTHWMWFIFPQLRGLGMSNMAYTYGIADLDEAKAYLAHDVLCARLIEISAELLNLEENNPKMIFGDIDAMKLKSSMTLFSLVSEDGSVFHKVLQKFFEGRSDAKTLELLASK